MSRDRGVRRNRDQKVILAVSCPVCGVEAGTMCSARTEPEIAQTDLGRPLVHGARRKAWQEWKQSRPVDVYARAMHPESGVLFPKTDEARERLLKIEDAVPGGVYVPNLREVIDRLTADGFHVE